MKTNASIAALGYAAFSITMTAGRIFGDWLAAKLKPYIIVRAGGFVAALGFLLAALARVPVLAILGFALVGIGLANLIPMLFSTAGKLPDFSPGTAIAGVATIGYVGFLAGPPLIGALTEVFSLRAAMGVVGLIMGTLVFTAAALKLEKRKNHVR